MACFKYAAAAANPWVAVAWHLPLQRRALAAGHTLCVAQADGPINLGGRQLAPLGARSSLDFPDVFLVPDALAGVVAPAAAAAAAAAPTWLHTQDLSIVTYVPPHPQADADWNHKLTQLETLIGQHRDADVFVAPEAYLCNMLGGRLTAVAAGDAATAWLRLAQVSATYPRMLIIPGTIIAQAASAASAASTSTSSSSSSSSSGATHNRTSVFLGGHCISADGRTNHLKADVSPESHLNLNFQPGPLQWFDFSFHSLRCRLHICADSFGCPPPLPIDLQIVVANNLGVRAKCVHEQGCYVLADAKGVSLCQLAGTPVAAHAAAAGCTTYRVSVKSNHVAAAVIQQAVAPVAALPGPVADLISQYLG